MTEKIEIKGVRVLGVSYKAAHPAKGDGETKEATIKADISIATDGADGVEALMLSLVRASKQGLFTMEVVPQMQMAGTGASKTSQPIGKVEAQAGGKAMTALPTAAEAPEPPPMASTRKEPAATPGEVEKPTGKSPEQRLAKAIEKCKAYKGEDNDKRNNLLDKVCKPWRTYHAARQEIGLHQAGWWECAEGLCFDARALDGMDAFMEWLRGEYPRLFGNKGLKIAATKAEEASKPKEMAASEESR